MPTLLLVALHRLILEVRHWRPALFEGAVGSGLSKCIKVARNGDALFAHYRHPLESLDNEKGTLGLISNKAQTSFVWAALRRR